MLIKFDDYPLHQTAEPLSYLATSERNAYGRYWYNAVSYTHLTLPTKRIV